MAKYVIFREEDYLNAIKEMAGYFNHGGFLMRRALGTPATLELPEYKIEITDA